MLDWFTAVETKALKDGDVQFVARRRCSPAISRLLADGAVQQMPSSDMMPFAAI